jgi:hypothetical protein
MWPLKKRIPWFSILIVSAVACISRPVRAQDAPVDRTVLPLAEPTYPPITELDARKATPPPRFEVKAPNGAPNGAILINGKKVATGRMEHTIPFLFGMETADVGIDLYTPVTSDYPKGKNRFTGRINKITIELKKMNPEAEAAAEKAAETGDEDEAEDA